MQIGSVSFPSRPIFLAPMEDVTDIGFRRLCKRFGADMVYTEFVSAEALVRSVASTMQKLTISDDERPVGIQLYGRDADAMVEAAKVVAEARPDVIDLNFGCPVKKVAGKGGGAGMLRNIPLMLDITSRIVEAVNLPVTVKTRLGWDADHIIIDQLAEQLQDCGIAALTIHGRTRAQMYTGSADWQPIARVKANQRIHIPIIGNGDLRTPDDVRQAFDNYGVDAVMVGRASFGQPWIFEEMKAERGEDKKESGEGNRQSPAEGQGREKRGERSFGEKLDILEELLRINVERIDERRGIIHTRRHLAATPLFKGIADFRSTRIAMLRADTLDELMPILEDIRRRFA